MPAIDSDVLISYKEETVASLPEPASQEVSREKKLVIRLAEWSLKYPLEAGQHVITYDLDEAINELGKIEKEAKECFSEYNKEDNKNT